MSQLVQSETTTAASGSIARDSFVTRPAFLRWLARGGISMVAASAALIVRTSRPAGATPEPPCPGGLIAAGCCCLVHSDGSCGGVNQPCSGGVWRSWSCCGNASHATWQCYECMKKLPDYPVPGTCKSKAEYVCSEAVQLPVGC